MAETATRTRGVDPAEIVRQRELGWPDFHPEDYCHRCGRPNIPAWFSPEWVELVGSHSGILCPVCFAALDPSPTVVWMVTREVIYDDEQASALASMLSRISDLGDDADRVARCILGAGYRRPRMRPLRRADRRVGLCRVCEGEYMVNRHGQIHRHGAGRKCPGSGQAPLDVGT